MRQAPILMIAVFLCGCMQFRLEQEAFQKIFKDRSIQPVSETIEVGANHIHYVYIDQGKANLAVFIHGSPGSWSAFLDFFKNDSLLQTYDVLSIDRPGFGASDYGRPEPSLQKQAYYLEEVIRRFDQPNKVMVGHSLGGPVAARIAMDYPNLTQAMVLVAPSVDPAMERYEWYRTWIETRIGGWVTPTDFWVSNEEILPLKDELDSLLPLWKSVRIPAIVIQGTKDALVPKENAEFVRRMMGDSLTDIRYLKGVNHFIPWSHPHEIVKALQDLGL